MEQKFMLNFSLCGKKKEKFVIYYQRDLWISLISCYVSQDVWELLLYVFN